MGMDGDTLRALYPEILKRLDDSNDAVRCAGCAALALLPCATPAAQEELLRGMPAQYTLDTLLIHLDDGDAGVQSAVYGAAAAWMRVEPEYGRKKAVEARGRMRHTAYVDKLIAFCDAVTLEMPCGAGAAPTAGAGEITRTTTMLTAPPPPSIHQVLSPSTLHTDLL